MIVVYRALNKSSGKSYIGWTVNFRRRRATHFRDSRKGSNCAFHNALRKHGKNVFVWKILGEYETEEAAKTAEIQMIQEHQTLSPNGYNMTKGGDGVIPCEIVKAKMSANHYDCSGKNNPFYGKLHTNSTRIKISAAMIQSCKKRLGEKHHNSKISDNQRRKIFQLRAEGWLLRELSNRFAISIARVSKILSDISGRYE